MQRQMAWTVFAENVDALTAPYGVFAALLVARHCGESFWDAVPPDQLEAWIKAHVPAELSAFIARSLETARFKLAEKTALVRAADRYIASQRAADRASN
jgi:hypothetical protein